MKVINLENSEEAKLLDSERYIAQTEGEIKSRGFNYRGYVIELDSYDLISLFAKHKLLVVNLDGEYAAILKYNSNND